MLAGSVPGADDEDKSWTDAALKHALQCSQCDKLGEILGEADAEYHNPPAEHVDRQGPSHHISLEDYVGWELKTHVSEVEGCSQPRILLSRKMRVLSQPKRGLGTE